MGVHYTFQTEPLSFTNNLHRLQQKLRKNMILRQTFSQLVSWCLEPSQPQRITSGLNTNFTLSTGYSFHKSAYTSHVFIQPIYILRELNTGTRIKQANLFHSAGLHRNQCQPKPTQEKIGRGFGKNAGEWTGRVEMSKEEIPGSKRSTYGYILTYSRL